MEFARRPAVLAAVGVAATLVLALGVVVALRLGDGSVSENAALIGAVIALGGVFTTQLVNTGLEGQRTREAALRSYLGLMGQLLLKEGLREQPNERASREHSIGGHNDVGLLARAQTLTVLQVLDPDRKRIIVKFLFEASLIQKGAPVIDLSEANLSDANLSEIDDLRHVCLSKANLLGADLRKADLSGADLSEADLSGADLHGARLGGANMRNAVVTKEQLDTAQSLKGATMPDGSTHD